jgi:hypothetical protein
LAGLLATVASTAADPHSPSDHPLLEHHVQHLSPAAAAAAAAAARAEVSRPLRD